MDQRGFCPRVKARITESTIRPRTSSITAAPRIVVPSLVWSLPNSFNVCAEILTLVAVSSVPRNKLIGSEYPSVYEKAVPATKGTTTPAEAETSAVTPTRRICFHTSDEHQENDADRGK